MTIAATYDIEIGARTAYMEARGEGQDGMRAVAWAIVNRHDSGKWYSGETVAECCLKPYQFSAWNTNDPNRCAAARIADNDPMIALCRGYIQGAMLNSGNDPTQGSTHYYSTDIPEPSWAASATFTVQIGRIRFYKGVA